MSIDTARTPGQLLMTLLEQRGWTQAVLATVLSVDRAVVQRMAADKKGIDAPMALALADIFGVEAETFLGLQKEYDLAVARIAAKPDPGRKNRATLFGELPVLEMAKRGWLDVGDVRDLPRVESALAKFFGVATAGDIEILPHAAKKTQVFSPITGAQLAWLYRVKQLAADMLVGRYSPAAVRAAIEKLRPLRASVDEVRRVPRILAECGIRYVIVESLPSGKIDGVCFWLDDFSPVIGMSLRHDRIDNFWFVLRHELEHVIRRHGRDAIMVDTDLDRRELGDVAEEELVANTAAADFCVPASDMDKFVARKAPFFAERDIIGFARTIKVHPGLVAGQLRHHTGRYDRFQSHLAKIRATVTPNAIADGWGNVVPVG